MNTTQTSAPLAPTHAAGTPDRTGGGALLVPAGVHAFLAFVTAVSNPRIASVELDGGVALVRLTNGVEFDAIVSFGSSVEFDLVSNEAGERWLKRNHYVLVHEVDRATARARWGFDLGGLV